MTTGLTVLDGGMGQELVRHFDGSLTPLWSAQIMRERPDLVVDLHRRFIRAGADVITVNAYSATRCRLGPAGVPEQYEPLQRLACELATRARDAEERHTRLAGCLSPYGWSYRPELAPPFDELLVDYTETAQLQAPSVDLFVCETLSSIDEARAAATAVATTGLPCWIALTLQDDRPTLLRSGERLADAVEAITGIDGVEAVLANCSTPEAVSAAIPTLVAGAPIAGGYANGFTNIADDFQAGTTVELLAARPDLGPDAYADLAMWWIDMGARIVGGCCEIGPDHIAEIARRTAARS